MLQEAGVSIIGENGLVAGAVILVDDTEDYSTISDNLSLENLLQQVCLTDDTLVLSIDNKDMSIDYFAQVSGSSLVNDQLPYDYTLLDISELGLNEKWIRDHYNGEMLVLQNRYFASVRRNNDFYLMVMRLLVTLNIGNLLSAIFGSSAVLIFSILLILAVSKIRIPHDENPSMEDQNLADNEQTQTSDSDDDMITMLSNIANRKKPYFEERWPSDGKKWRDRTPHERFITFVKLIGILTFAGIVLHTIFAGENSIWYYCIRGEWRSGINLYSITSCIIKIILLFLLKELLHKALYLIARAAQSKGETICHLLDSFSGYALFIVGIFMILESFGVSVATLSITGGVAGVIFGIGCQNIVADILAGILMTFEGVAAVGDFVSYSGKYGIILSIGVRTTRLKWFGEITVVRNNEFKNYINVPSEENNRIVSFLCIDFRESLERVEGIIENELLLIHDNLCEQIGEEISGPKYRGVQGIEDNGIRLSFCIFCKGKYYSRMKRLLNRELLLMCNRNDIRLAVPQIMINKPADKNV